MFIEESESFFFVNKIWISINKMESEDIVTNIEVENSTVVKPEFIKKEPTLVYLDTYIKDHGVSEDDLAQFQYFNSDVNIKPEPTATGSHSCEHDSFKNEIEEEPNRESICDTLDDSYLNEYSLKIEIEEQEIKFRPHEEKQTNKI
uniref:Uncharacterized protein LOC114347211 n=1 Tax=Diabrotica virgifera virgifera TaxID=50390 RepID=A0A6P7HD90_DIAVI